MASIHKEVPLAAPADAVWAALRDAGEVRHLFPGVLAESRLEGDCRVVAFAGGGPAVRERIVAVDDDRRRIAYAVVREGVVHHNASMQVVAEGEGRCRFVWTSDFLPDGLAASFGPLIERGTAAIRRVFEAWPDRPGAGLTAGARPAPR